MIAVGFHLKYLGFDAPDSQILSQVLRCAASVDTFA